MRFRALMGLQMLVERAFVAHWLLANVANVLQTIVRPSVVYLLMALETVIGGKG